MNYRTFTAPQFSYSVTNPQVISNLFPLTGTALDQYTGFGLHERFGG